MAPSFSRNVTWPYVVCLAVVDIRGRDSYYRQSSYLGVLIKSWEPNCWDRAPRAGFVAALATRGLADHVNRSHTAGSAVVYDDLGGFPECTVVRERQVLVLRVEKLQDKIRFGQQRDP